MQGWFVLMKSHEIKNLAELEQLMIGFRALVDVRLGQLLCEAGALNEKQLSQALREQKLVTQQRLGQIVVKKGWVSKEKIDTAMAYKLGIPLVRLRNYTFDKQMLTVVPEDLIKKFRVLPLGEINGRLVVATDCPFDSDALDALRFNAELPVDFVFASSSEINALSQRYLSGQHEADALIDMEGFETGKYVLPPKVEAEALDKPIVQLLNNIISQAVGSLASDINIRPGSESVSLFYRLDGKMTHIKEFNKQLLPALVSRIKIMGEMNIAEKRLPQDGHATVDVEHKSVDLRISVIPTLQGESVVIRILDKHLGLMSIEELGIDTRGVSILRDALSRHQGMVLVTGPTGAGKSTTLYSLVNQAKNGRERHILTIEDPVEYELAGVEQVQVVPKRGLDFATALRQFLRHDPDVIMVGEIRDDETAQIANKAALTGHVVLSTLHTRNAISTIQRLYDMGVEPYLLASTLSCVVAQRLVRKICPHCSTKDAMVSDELYQRLHLTGSEVFFKGLGCYQCHSTGYSGRVSVSEVLEITPEFADHIAQKSPRKKLMALAEAQGMERLFSRGLALATQGVTSLEEVLGIRVD